VLSLIAAFPEVPSEIAGRGALSVGYFSVVPL